eukprot:CAMPEP_0172624876 /NCGR_PEP_ID=MMETSP1068-20121228/139831_1 /TAXON_ID=35684 /ORGANISM="Pseudopedinella elastica, Strain CCMP716" /LENGTH=375 /DNA_ID=CAMNT_0013433977 /DNA_START=243 /DNA_END=1370 /DNA_ORIENTATION=-
MRPNDPEEKSRQSQKRCTDEPIALPPSKVHLVSPRIELSDALFRIPARPQEPTMISFTDAFALTMEKNLDLKPCARSHAFLDSLRVWALFAIEFHDLKQLGQVVSILGECGLALNDILRAERERELATQLLFNSMSDKHDTLLSIDQTADDAGMAGVVFRTLDEQELATYIGTIPPGLLWLREATTGPNSSKAVWVDISTIETSGKVDYKCMANFAFQTYVQTPEQIIEDIKRGGCSFASAKEIEIVTCLHLRGSAQLETTAPIDLDDGSTWKSVKFDFRSNGLQSFGSGFLQMTTTCYEDGKTAHANFLCLELENICALGATGILGEVLGIREQPTPAVAASSMQCDHADLFMETGEPLFLSRTEESELWGAAV